MNPLDPANWKIVNQFSQSLRAMSFEAIESEARHLFIECIRLRVALGLRDATIADLKISVAEMSVRVALLEGQATEGIDCEPEGDR